MIPSFFNIFHGKVQTNVSILGSFIPQNSLNVSLKNVSPVASIGTRGPQGVKSPTPSFGSDSARGARLSVIGDRLVTNATPATKSRSQ